MALTVSKIEQAVKAGTAKEVSDGAHGLTLIVKAGGTASFTVKYKWAGGADKIGIGPVILSDIKASLDRARVRALEVRQQAEAGIDPKKAVAGSGLNRTSPRWIEVAREVMESECEDIKSAKGKANWVRNIEVQAKPLHDMQCHTIDLPDVSAVLKPIWKKYPKSGREMRGRLHKVFRKIIVNKWGATGSIGDINPADPNLIASSLGEHKERIVEGFASMPYEEVGALVAKLWAMNRTDADTLLLLILGCGRSGETIALEWTEVDAKPNLIQIPGRKMKNGRRCDQPISTAMRMVLDRRKALRQPGDVYVFPGAIADKQHPDVLRDLMAELGISSEDATPHGFRGAYRTWADEVSDLDQTACEFVLHHITGDDAQVAYRKGSMIAKRLVVLNTWAAYLNIPAVEPAHLQLVA